MADAALAGEPRPLLRGPVEPHEGGDALGGGHELGAREGDAEPALGVERGEQGRLNGQGQVPVAGGEAVVGVEPALGGLAHDAGLGGVRGALHEGARGGVEDELVHAAGEREAPELALVGHAQGHREHADGAGAREVGPHGLAGKLERRALEAPYEAPVLLARLRALEDAHHARRPRDRDAALDARVDAPIERRVHLLARVAQVAQDLAAVDGGDVEGEDLACARRHGPTPSRSRSA